MVWGVCLQEWFHWQYYSINRQDNEWPNNRRNNRKGARVYLLLWCLVLQKQGNLCDSNWMGWLSWVWAGNKLELVNRPLIFIVLHTLIVCNSSALVCACFFLLPQAFIMDLLCKLIHKRQGLYSCNWKRNCGNVRNLSGLCTDVHGIQ